MATGVWISSRYRRSFTVSAAIRRNITASSCDIWHISTSFTYNETQYTPNLIDIIHHSGNATAWNIYRGVLEEKLAPQAANVGPRQVAREAIIFGWRSGTNTYGYNFVARLNATVGGGRFTDQRPNAMAQHRFVFLSQCESQRALLLHHDYFKFLQNANDAMIYIYLDLNVYKCRVTPRPSYVNCCNYL